MALDCTSKWKSISFRDKRSQSLAAHPAFWPIWGQKGPENENTPSGEHSSQPFVSTLGMPVNRVSWPYSSNFLRKWPKTFLKNPILTYFLSLSLNWKKILIPQVFVNIVVYIQIKYQKDGTKLRETILFENKRPSGLISWQQFETVCVWL